MAKLPDAGEYAKACIQDLRKRRKNMKPGTMAGVNLYRIYQAMRELYDDAEIVVALSKEAKAKRLCVAVRGETMIWDSKDEKHVSTGTFTRSVVDVSPFIPATHIHGDRDENFCKIADSSGQLHLDIKEVSLYVVADGVPDHIKKAMANEVPHHRRHREALLRKAARQK